MKTLLELSSSIDGLAPLQQLEKNLVPGKPLQLRYRVFDSFSSFQDSLNNELMEGALITNGKEVKGIHLDLDSLEEHGFVLDDISPDMFIDISEYLQSYPELLILSLVRCNAVNLSLSTFPQLRFLALFGCQLDAEELLGSSVEHEQITELVINYPTQELEELPPAKLTKLKVLNLCSNHIEKITGNLEYLPALQKIYLYDNETLNTRNFEELQKSYPGLEIHWKG
ncbi:MAG: hypothetical protein AAF518_19385 [Spirochaetota bacterium]